MKQLNILNRQADGQMDSHTGRQLFVCHFGRTWVRVDGPCLSTGSGFLPARQGLPHVEPDVIGTDVVLEHSTVFPYTGDWR